MFNPLLFIGFFLLPFNCSCQTHDFAFPKGSHLRAILYYFCWKNIPLFDPPVIPRIEKLKI